MDLPAKIRQAESNIRPHVLETRLLPSPELTRLGGAETWLKLENEQHTGSFKLRGAVNKLLSMNAAQRARGVVTASTGNHGAAVAHAARVLQCQALIYAPTNASPSKLAAIEALGARLQRVGDDCVVSEAAARQFAQEKGLTYVSPYNDFEVIAGQGTLAVEILRQIDGLDAVYVAMGGGGLFSGVATALKAAWPDVQLIACSPSNSAVLLASIAAGKILDLPSKATLSDATAGGVEAGAITLDLCRQLVDRSMLVAEDEIQAAMDLIREQHGMVIEGAAGVAVAAYLKDTERGSYRRVGIIVCGGNTSEAGA